MSSEPSISVDAVPLATARVGDEAHQATETRIPAAVLTLLVVWLSTNGIVRWEPAPTDLAFGALCVAVVIHGFSLRGLSVLSLVGAALFILANLVSMLPARSASGSIKYFAITAYLMATWAVLGALVQRFGKQTIDPAVRALIASAMLAATIGILAKYGMIPGAGLFLMDEAGTRVKGPFKDPNVFGPFLGLAVTLLVAGWVERGNHPVPRVLALGLLCFGVFLSFSRGAYANLAASLGLFAVLLVFVVRDRQASRRLVGISLIAAVAAVPVVVYLAMGSEFAEFLRRRMTLQDYDNNRFATHDLAINFAQYHPLGIGPGGWTAERFGMATHNVYLRVLTENGWFGLASFLVFCCAGIASSLRGAARGGEHAVLQAALCGVLVANLLESFIIDSLHWRHLFVTFGLITGVSARQATLQNHAPEMAPPSPQANTSSREVPALPPLAVPSVSLQRVLGPSTSVLSPPTEGPS